MTEITNRWFYRHIHVPEIDSTNSHAFTLGREGADAGTVVTADSQCKGRGQRGNHWHSPAGKGLYYSLLLRPAMSADRIALITLTAGIAVVDMLCEQFDLRASLKWPNDILLSGRKVAGILTESSWHGDCLEFVVIGIGLNLDWADEEFPPDLAYPATSLYRHTAKRLSTPVLVEALTASLQRWTVRLAEHETGMILDAWRDRTDMLGRIVEVSHSSGTRQGLAVGLDERGSLLVDTPGKGVTAITAGMVRFVD